MMHILGAALLILFVGVVIIVLNVWDHRHPMTPEEQQDLEDEMRIW